MRLKVIPLPLSLQVLLLLFVFMQSINGLDRNSQEQQAFSNQERQKKQLRDLTLEELQQRLSLIDQRIFEAKTNINRGYDSLNAAKSEDQPQDQGANVMGKKIVRQSKPLIIVRQSNKNPLFFRETNRTVQDFRIVETSPIYSVARKTLHNNTVNVEDSRVSHNHLINQMDTFVLSNGKGIYYSASGQLIADLFSTHSLSNEQNILQTSKRNEYFYVALLNRSQRVEKCLFDDSDGQRIHNQENQNYEMKNCDSECGDENRSSLERNSTIKILKLQSQNKDKERFSHFSMTAHLHPPNGINIRGYKHFKYVRQHLGMFYLFTYERSLYENGHIKVKQIQIHLYDMKGNFHRLYELQRVDHDVNDDQIISTVDQIGNYLIIKLKSGVLLSVGFKGKNQIQITRCELDHSVMMGLEGINDGGDDIAGRIEYDDSDSRYFYFFLERDQGKRTQQNQGQSGGVVYRYSTKSCRIMSKTVLGGLGYGGSGVEQQQSSDSQLEYYRKFMKFGDGDDFITGMQVKKLQYGQDFKFKSRDQTEHIVTLSSNIEVSLRMTMVSASAQKWSQVQGVLSEKLSQQPPYKNLSIGIPVRRINLTKIITPQKGKFFIDTEEYSFELIKKSQNQYLLFFIRQITIRRGFSNNPKISQQFEHLTFIDPFLLELSQEDSTVSSSYSDFWFGYGHGSEKSDHYNKSSSITMTFRFPLLMISVGIIMYVLVKNKKGDENQERNVEKMLRRRIEEEKQKQSDYVDRMVDGGEGEGEQ